MKRQEVRAEVEALVRRFVPEEIDNVDEMMNQFKGREEQLIETLRTMQPRAVAQKARAAGHKADKQEARRHVKSSRGNSGAAAAAPDGNGGGGSSEEEEKKNDLNGHHPPPFSFRRLHQEIAIGMNSIRQQQQEQQHCEDDDDDNDHDEESSRRRPTNQQEDIFGGGRGAFGTAAAEAAATAAATPPVASTPRSRRGPPRLAFLRANMLSPRYLFPRQDLEHTALEDVTTADDNQELVQRQSLLPRSPLDLQNHPTVVEDDDEDASSAAHKHCCCGCIPKLLLVFFRNQHQHRAARIDALWQFVRPFGNYLGYCTLLTMMIVVPTVLYHALKSRKVDTAAYRSAAVMVIGTIILSARLVYLHLTHWYVRPTTKRTTFSPYSRILFFLTLHSLHGAHTGTCRRCKNMSCGSCSWSPYMLFNPICPLSFTKIASI
jgi:hypothetical protein